MKPSEIGDQRSFPRAGVTALLRSAELFGDHRTSVLHRPESARRHASGRAATVAATLALLVVPLATLAVNLTTSTIDGGGLHTTSANYAVDGSVGGIGGISSASVDTMKGGYIGQLTEVVSVTVTAELNSVGVGSTSQLSGTATLDDNTVSSLSGSDVAWSSPNEPYPVASISGAEFSPLQTCMR